MMKKCLFLVFLFCVGAPVAAQAMTEADFTAMLEKALSTPAGQKAIRAALEQALQKQPDLVLDVLADHAGEVFLAAQKGAAEQKRKAFYARWKNDAQQPKNLNLAHHAGRGEADAPVNVVVFSDFTCSYCELASRTIAALQKKMPGAFRYVFKPHPARNSEAATRAAQWFMAASLRDPGKAWALYDLLFDGAGSLLDNPDSFLREAATQAGFDADLLESEAAGRQVADLLAADQEEAARLGVSGTPYLFINDLVIPGAPDEALLREAVERAAGAAKP